MAIEPKRQFVAYEEFAYSQMLQVQACIELLEEKGVLTQREVLERVKRLERQTARTGVTMR